MHKTTAYSRSETVLRVTAQASAAVLMAALSACASKSPGSMSGAGPVSGAKSVTSAGTAGDKASSGEALVPPSGRNAAAGDARDPFNDLKNRPVPAASGAVGPTEVAPLPGAASRRDGGTGAGASPGRDAYQAGHDPAKYDPVAEAIARDERARSEAAARTGAAEQDAHRDGYDQAAYDPVAEAIARYARNRAGTVASRDDNSAEDAHRDGYDHAAYDPVAAAIARDRAAVRGGGSPDAPGATAAAGNAVTNGESGGVDAHRDGHDHAAHDPVAAAIARDEASRADGRRGSGAADARDDTAAVFPPSGGAGERRGRVETLANRVLIDENDRLQTLDGMLPMALSMDDKGLFDFDRYELRSEVKATLDTLAARLNESAYDRLHIVGYADRIGTDEYNKNLSEKRAWAVAGYLMNRGVPPHKLRVEGRGEQDSAADGDQCDGLDRARMIECLQHDRRVEIAATVKEYQLRVQ
ncbi:MAG: OmpA family protein [Betaproteobacteria bacterium]